MMSDRHATEFVLASIAFALIAGCGEKKDASAPQAQPASTASVASAPTVELPSFVTLVKKEGPVVVNVTTVRTVRQSAEAAPGMAPDDPMYEFFRRFLPQPPTQEFQAQGLGSGFIITQDGYILTNAHVVADADEATVGLTSKRQFKAKIVGIDARTDVALLKIDASGLPFVKIGDPGRLEVGEWVAAIGAPFGLENTVTAGIVSAKGRSLPEDTYVPFIQSDVALNPGNSGGPLFNMRGEVVGINSMIYSQTGGYMGLSFTIPIDLAMDISKQLQASGKVTRGRIGVQAQDLSADMAASFGLTEPNGALVAMVEKGGPADQAGKQPGDVILAFNEKPVQNSADLARLVAGTKPGTTATADISRKGARQSTKVTVPELPPEPPARAAGRPRPPG
ncbi:S1C family serine protease [Noviherbaspirillum malthae]|uniref:S1C family serine protease n=1 Tax=Noviherbaspirillum malthae TaxID=1260987 RepID=UPI002B273CFD|nr:Do family serine endopeptidase [Noviherbaspirillum malthae]